MSTNTNYNKENIRVLIVDDSPLFCLKAADALKSEKNIAVTCCTDAAKALAIVKEFSPTTIIQDLNMPGISGLDLIKAYRKDRSTMNIPVIVHSSEEDREIKEKVFAVGANDYLVKGDDETELVARTKYHSKRYIRMRSHRTAEPITKMRTHQVKVLMVDDMKLSCLMVEDILSEDRNIKFRYCTETAKALEEAIDFLPTVIIQSLITDSSKDGFKLIEEFRNNRATKDVPIIIRSSFDDVKKKTKAFNEGANDYLVKPDDDCELLSRVRLHSGEYINFLEGAIYSNFSSRNAEENVIRVLMIDDSEVLCHMIGNMLASERNIVFTYCKEPENAIKTAKRFNPTVILLDMVLPGISGLELIEMFRENPVTCDVPIIIISQREEATIKAKSFALGANDFIPKSVDKIELISRINYHANGYRNHLRLKSAIQHLLETQKRLEIYGDFIKKTFGRYLSDDVAASILDNPKGMKLGGEKREVTILISDLRNFTPLVENNPPEKVLLILNNYFKVMTDILMNYGATIDEFIGDAILAVFGAPVLYEDHAVKAVACALEMQIAMKSVNAKNIEAGLPEISMGIGVNTGEVIMGNIGSERRTKFGIIGRAVNLTSRIEEYTTGGQILISRSTMEPVKDILKIKMEMTKEPKGIKEPITVYDIYGLGGEYNLTLP